MSRFLPSVAPDLRSGHAEDLKAIKAVLPYLWPEGDGGLKLRVMLAVGILGVTAMMNALVPVLFAAAVDHLTPADTPVVVAAPVALLLG